MGGKNVKTSLSIKTLLRTVLKTGLTFLLIAVVTFALFSQAVVYSISSQAFNASVAQYSGVVTVCDEMPVTDHRSHLYSGGGQL